MHESTITVFTSSQLEKWLHLAMIKQHLGHILLISTIAMLIGSMIGCMDSRVTSTEDLPGSQFRGSVKLYAEDNSFEINKNLVLVRLEGTGFETLTDTAGKWILNLIPQGAYTIVYSKPGYSTAKRFSVRCDGKLPVIVQPMTLAQLPSYTVDEVEAIIKNDSLTINCRTATIANQDRRVILYFDTVLTDQQTRNSYLYTSLDLIIPSGSNSATLSIPLAQFSSLGIQKGATLFCTAFSIVRFEATAEESFLAIDPITKKTLFWNVRLPGAVATCTLPK